MIHKTELEKTLQQLEDEEMQKLRNKTNSTSTKCSLCKKQVEDGKVYLFETLLEKAFCKSCYDKIAETTTKKLGAQQIVSRNFPS
jgi:hypothetical protein